jgi:nucleotide-binding universal stress UspA family protein
MFREPERVDLREEANMQGTLVCTVSEGAENDAAVSRAVDLSERLGLRLVLAHVADGFAGVEEGDESFTMKGHRKAAERRLAELSRAYGVERTAERRVVIGDAATLGQVATEEAADVIVVGARARGWGRRGLESRLAHELEAETPVPVLIAPPQRRPVTNGRHGERDAGALRVRA